MLKFGHLSRKISITVLTAFDSSRTALLTTCPLADNANGIWLAAITLADCVRRFRQQHSVPVLKALKSWLDTIAPKIVPDTKLGDAVSYTLNQWDYLTRYISDGRMPIDNNILERDIRVFPTGRKSWLFSDTADGAKASAVIYSLMLTCRACGVDPLTWLRHVLAELPQREEAADISDLLPFNVSKASAA